MSAIEQEQIIVLSQTNTTMVNTVHCCSPVRLQHLGWRYIATSQKCSKSRPGFTLYRWQYKFLTLQYRCGSQLFSGLVLLSTRLYRGIHKTLDTNFYLQQRLLSPIWLWTSFYCGGVFFVGLFVFNCYYCLFGIGLFVCLNSFSVYSFWVLFVFPRLILSNAVFRFCFLI